MPAIADLPRTHIYFGDGLRMTLGYAERLLKDIPAAKFVHMPHPQMNHPAFCVGHLSMYPNRLFNMLGRSDLVIEKTGYVELFPAGIECVEQPGRYPQKEELVNYYFERYRAIEKLLPSISDETFALPNPAEGRLRELFPTIGSACNFLLNNHQMLHLGQISAWRRAVGLPPA